MVSVFARYGSASGNTELLCVGVVQFLLLEAFVLLPGLLTLALGSICLEQPSLSSSNFQQVIVLLSLVFSQLKWQKTVSFKQDMTTSENGGPMME